MVGPVVLPPVGPGENPFVAYEEPIKRLLYLKPSRGLKARLIVLITLGVILLTLNLTFVFCQRLIRRRSGTRFWLYKRIDRKAGRFVVVNTVSAKQVMGTFLPVFTIGQCALVWSAFLTSNGVRLSTVMIWSKIGLWPCLFFCLWQGLWANLHVYLRLRDDTSGPLRFLTARVVNSLFLGGAAVGVLTLCTTTTVSAVFSLRYSARFAALIDFVHRAGLSWNEGDDISSQQATIRTLWQEFESALALQKRLSSYFWAITTVGYFMIFIVNLAAFPLIVSLRRQIRASLEELQSPTVPVLDPQPNLVPLKTQSSAAKVPTLSEVKAMAERQSAGLEGAKRLRSMERSATDIQAQSTAAIILIVCQISFAIFFSTVYPTITRRAWWVSELVIFGPLYCTLIPITLAFCRFTRNAIQDARVQLVEVRGPNGRLSSNTVHSFVGPAVVREKGWIDHEEDALPLGLLQTIVARRDASSEDEWHSDKDVIQSLQSGSV